MLPDVGNKPINVVHLVRRDNSCSNSLPKLFVRRSKGHRLCHIGVREQGAIHLQSVPMLGKAAPRSWQVLHCSGRAAQVLDCQTAAAASSGTGTMGG